jgi:single-stranded DNA-binding protein
MNLVIQRGNLGGSPVIKTKGDVTYARFSYAVNSWGERPPQWYSAVAFGKLALTLGQLGKGDEILVEGEPQDTRYTKDGVEHHGFEVRVRRVEFLRRKDRSNGNGEGGPGDLAGASDTHDDQPPELDAADPGTYPADPADPAAAADSTDPWGDPTAAGTDPTDFGADPTAAETSRRRSRKAAA